MTESVAESLVFTVAEFCESHRLSRSTFYELLKEGRAPKTMQIGRRRLISSEAAAEWRAKITEESQ